MAAAAAGAPPVYTKEGAGTYGLVVSPALPNVNETGAIQRFPGMVSKVMIEEDKYHEALEAMEKLKRDAPALSFNFVPYRREYRYANLPTAQMRTWMRDQMRQAGHPDPYNAQRIYVARMPNLGKSFKNIAETPELRRAYRALGPDMLLRQVLKLCRVVKNVKDSGYVHADIRETNVLANVQTGDMTIIDFDWLREKDAYYDEYPQFFYSHPPEELFFFTMTDADLRNYFNDPNRAAIERFIRRTVSQRAARQVPYMFWGVNIDPLATTLTNVIMQMYDRVQAAPMAQRNEVAQAEIDRMRAASFVTVDSYGLALSIVKLTNAVIGAVGPLSDFLIGDWAARMLSYNVFGRQTIEQSIERLEKYIRENHPDIQLGEAPDIGDELARLGALAELLEDKPPANNAPRNVREEVEALALITRYLDAGVPQEDPAANEVPTPPQPAEAGGAAAGGGAANVPVAARFPLRRMPGSRALPMAGGKRRATRHRSKKRKATRRRRGSKRV